MDSTEQDPQTAAVTEMPVNATSPAVLTPNIEIHDDSSDDDYLEWSAVETMMFRPTLLWYIGLFVVITGLIGLAVWLKLWFSIALFAVMGVAIAVYAHRRLPPISYRVDNHGLTIDGRFYAYSGLKTFGIVNALGWQAVDFTTNKRFMPRLMVLYNDDQTKNIVAAFLAEYLPREDRKPSWLEIVSRYLHLS